MDYFKNILPEKKKNLLQIYLNIESVLKKIQKNIVSNNIQKGRYMLSELFVELCDCVNVIDEKDYKDIKNFKTIFFENIVHPPLFGKTKLNNTKYVTCVLEQLIMQISEKVSEYKEFLNLTAN